MSRLVDEKKLEPIKFQLDEERGTYIAFLGDLIDSPDELENPQKRKQLLDLIRTSANIAPTMIVLGSHDFIVEESYPGYNEFFINVNEDFWSEVCSINNVYLLVDDIFKDDQVLFMGYTQTLEYYYDKLGRKMENLEEFYKDFVNHPELYQNLSDDVVKVGLIHSPEYAKDNRNAELFGVGHFNRGLISPKKVLFSANVRGFRYLKTGTGLLISGGIVKIQDCAPKILHPLNHLCPMQMDTITFTSDEKKEVKNTS